MNKRELIEKVSEKMNISKADTERVLDVITTTIRKEVVRGNDVKIIGFGTFTKAKRKARMGRNPQTGVLLKIPATWYPKFRAGEEFKTMVR